MADDDLLGEVLRQPLEDPERNRPTRILLMVGVLVVALGGAVWWWLSRPSSQSAAPAETTASTLAARTTTPPATTAPVTDGSTGTTDPGPSAPPADAIFLDLVALDDGDLLLFGGATANLAAPGGENWIDDLSWLVDSIQQFDGIWRFDPLTAEWSLEATNGLEPPPRFGAAVAFHPPTGRVIVFGGGDPEFRACPGIKHCPGTETAEVWQYDPATGTWEDMTPEIDSETSWPSARFGQRFAYEPITQRLVTFGGATTTGQTSGTFGPSYTVELANDTWAYDPATNTWEELSSSSDEERPAAVVEYALAWSSEAEGLVMFGGDGDSYGFGSDPLDLHLFDPATSTWTDLGAGDSTEAPQERWLHSLVEDPRTGRIVSIGGAGSIIETIAGGTTRRTGPIEDVWAWSPDAGWEPLQAAPGPILTSAATADTATGDLIVWDGTTVWAYDATLDVWSELWIRPVD